MKQALGLRYQNGAVTQGVALGWYERRPWRQERPAPAIGAEQHWRG